jgi:SAM-dependent methyltransferase
VSQLPNAARLSPVVRSNIAVHTTLAETYALDEPHYRPENKAKVKANLLRVAERTGTTRMLDIGCGAGFVIDLLKDTFAEIHGLDATRAMLDRVDTSAGNVVLHEGVAERLPFTDASFDLVTDPCSQKRPACCDRAVCCTSTWSRTERFGPRLPQSNGTRRRRSTRWTTSSPAK